MAELANIRIKDFRAFRDAQLDLSSNGLILVAGPNNSGKSALLSALDVVAGVPTPHSGHHAGSDRYHIYARFNLDEKEREALLGVTSDAAVLISEGAAKWVEWEFSELGGHDQPIAIRIAWPNNPTGLLIADMVAQGGARTVRWPSTPTIGNWSGNFISTPNYGGGLENFAGFDLPDIVKNILPNWRSGYFHFSPSRQVVDKEYQYPAMPPTPLLISDGGNLPAVLFTLRNNDTKRWEELSRLIKQIVPGVGSINTPITNTSFKVTFIDDYIENYQHNLKDLGTGVEQILMTLVVGLTQSARVILLEEPETGLHPTAQRALLGLLQEWSGDRLFIAATHSPSMLDWASFNTSILSVTRSQSNSSVSPINGQSADVLKNLGVRLSDVLSAENILILEGPSDKDVFEAWFPDDMRNPHLVIIPGGGGYNANHADLLVDWLSKADQLGQRKVLYIRDRDELSPSAFKKLDKSTNVYILPSRELENLLLDFDAIAGVINEERTRRMKDAITAEDIASSARKIADSLKSQIILKRVMAEFADPLRYVDNELRKKLATAGSGKQELTDAILQRIPSEVDIKTKVDESWKNQQNDIDKNWETEWQNIAPGEEILSALWHQYLDRGYKKSSSDGARIAKAMTSAPEELKTIVKHFMTDAS